MVTGGTINGRSGFLAILIDYLGFPVTVDTPPHRKVGDLSQAIHAFHRAVAALARHAATQMSFVIEACVSRKIMDFYPGDWLWGFLWVRLEFAIKSKSIVELLQFG